MTREGPGPTGKGEEEAGHGGQGVNGGKDRGEKGTGKGGHGKKKEK